MTRFLAYAPEQAYLLPPTVGDELGEDHLCFFIRRVVAHLDLRGFEEGYSAEGGELYHPAMMLSVWLYAYAVGMTSAAAGAAGGGGLGAAVFGGRGEAGQLGAECVSAAAWAGAERCLYAGAGDGAELGDGEAGASGH